MHIHPYIHMYISYVHNILHKYTCMYSGYCIPWPKLTVSCYMQMHMCLRSMSCLTAHKMKEGSGQIDFPTFRAMCKKNLKLEESKEQMQATAILHMSNVLGCLSTSTRPRNRMLQWRASYEGPLRHAGQRRLQGDLYYTIM